MEVKMPECTKDADKSKYLERLNKRISKEMKDFVKSDKGQVKIKIDDKNDL